MMLSPVQLCVILETFIEQSVTPGEFMVFLLRNPTLNQQATTSIQDNAESISHEKFRIDNDDQIFAFFDILPGDEKGLEVYVVMVRTWNVLLLEFLPLTAIAQSPALSNSC